MRPQYSITTQPATEPITYAQAAEHLRVDSTDDTDYITALIPVAREFIDSVTGRASIVATYKLIAESWESLFTDRCADVFRIGRTPLATVTSIKYYAPDAASLTTMSASDYRVVTAAEPGIVQIHGTIPAVDDRPDAIEVIFTAGHANAAVVSATHKHAIKMLVAHLYENRMPVAFASCNEIPMTLQTLIANLKVGGWVA